LNDNAGIDNASLPSPPIQFPPPSGLSRIFVGKDGLRAGWSLLVFAALAAAVFVIVGLVVHNFFPNAPTISRDASEQPLTAALLLELTPLAAVFFASWIMSKLERRPVSVYGLRDQHKLAHFFAGFAWGIIFLSLLVLILWRTHLLVIDRRLLFGGDIFRHGIAWLFFFCLVGLNEEYLTRGYIQYTLTRGLAGFYQWAFKTRHSKALGFWTSAIIWSTLFGISHFGNPDESPIGLLSAGLIGLVFCLSLWRTGSLWWAIGFHALWDWSQSFLYGVADSGIMIQHHFLATHPIGKPIFSGGATGPEGSIFIVGIVGLVAVIILLTLHRERRGDAVVR
jgi:uncharacterized protein